MRTLNGIDIYEIGFTVHTKDHEPDWPYGVCRLCGVSQIREVCDDGATQASEESVR